MSHKTPAVLALADGSLFHGQSIGAEGLASGEVVFNTAMTGYQEILTDPSYARQLVTLTCPHVGNTGVNGEDQESDSVFAEGLIIRATPRRVSSFRAQQSLPDYLVANNIVAIADVDTRALTRHLRDEGAQAGSIVTGGGEAAVAKGLDSARAFGGLGGLDLAREVTASERYEWKSSVWCLQGSPEAPATESDRQHVVAFDFGVKQNILRLLVDRGARVTVVPATTTAEEVAALQPDGVFLSNGPGDPEPCDYAIAAIRTIVDRGIPVFGICLGHQLLALASGARTEKMKTGHHGANHPVQDLDDGRVYITSQNHGFTVSEETGDLLKITHRSLFDGTIQGLKRVDKPAFSFQGHPEASPGPHDICQLFDRFAAAMRNPIRVDSSLPQTEA